MNSKGCDRETTCVDSIWKEEEGAIAGRWETAGEMKIQ